MKPARVVRASTFSARYPLTLAKEPDREQYTKSTGGMSSGLRQSVDCGYFADIMGLHRDGEVRPWDDTATEPKM